MKDTDKTKDQLIKELAALRKQTEDALRASEERLRETQRAAHLGSWDWNIATGDLFWSDETFRMFGFEPRGFVPTYDIFTTVVHPDDMKRVQENVDAALKNEKEYDVEFRCVLPSKKVRHIQCQGALTTNAAGQAIRFSGTQFDITDRKRAEHGLRKSDEKYRGFVESATDALSLFDSELNYIDINKNGLSYWPPGMEKSDLIGKNLADLIPTIKDSGRYDKYLEVIKTGEPFTANDAMPGPQFGDIHLIVKAFRVGDGMGLIATDITERKHTEEALRESESRYRMLFENGSLGLILADVDGHPIDGNPAIQKMLGYSIKELSEMVFEDFTCHEDFDNDIELFAELLEGKRDSYQVDKRYYHKNGDVVWAQVGVSTIRHEETERQVIIGMITDITKEKQAAGEIESLAKFPSEDPSPVMRISADGMVLYRNEASRPLLRSWEYEEGQTIATTWQTMVNKALSANKSVQTEVECNDKILSLTFAPIRAAKYVNIYGLDITERKQAEEAHRKSEEKYRSFIENFQGIAFRGEIGEYIPIFFQGAVNEITGYSEEEFIAGKPKWDQIVYPGDLTEYLRASKGPPHNRKPLSVEYRIIHKDGRIRWVQERNQMIFDDHGGPLYVDGVIYDITEHKKFEEEISANAERFNRWKASNFIGIIQSKASGDVIDANETVLEMLGYTRQEMLDGNLDWTILTPHEFLRLSKAAIEEAKARGYWAPFEMEYYHKDGHRVQVLVGGSIYHMDPEEHIVFVIDISERKRSEVKLQQYAHIVSSSSDMMALLDSKFTYITLNNSYAGAFALSPEQMVGKTVIDLFGQEFFNTVIRHPAERCLMGDEVNYQEWFDFPALGHRYMDVTYYPNQDDNDKTVGAVINCRDLTERKKSEDALRESTERFRTAVINAPYQIMLHAEGGEILQLSKSWTEITGYTHEEIPNTFEWAKRAYGKAELDEDAIEAINSAYKLKGRERQDDGVWPVITKSGEMRYWDFSTTQLGALSDGRNLVITMAIDITERQKTELALRESGEQLKQAQKLESVGRLAGGVAHDFNNLLTTILGYSELISIEPNLSDGAVEGVQEIRKAAERAATLTQQLLAFSRKQILQPRQIDLNELITNSKNMLSRLIPADITFNTLLCTDIWLITADPGQIEQVIMNLTVNAGDAMPDGGTFTVETNNVCIDEINDQDHPEVGAGDYVEIKVSDTGDGMDEETLERIFDPFYTTKEVGKGTGLGLATVHGIIIQSGGYIWASSKPRLGTTFAMYFPAGIEDERQKVRIPQRNNIVGGNEKILIVDDDKALRIMAKRILEGHGYAVIEAANGKEALSRVEEAGFNDFDCLVTDIIMPEMGGKELSERLTADHPSLKTLFISGYTEDSITSRGVQEGGITFLQKPFSPQTLAETIRKLFDED